MEVSSSQQVNIFLLCILSGCLCGAFYDIQRFLRKKTKPGKVRVFVEDCIFCAFCIFVIIGTGFIFNNGELRYYQLLGAASGALFYAAALSRFFMKLFDFFFFLIEKIIVKPIKKIITLILIPLKGMTVKIRKLNNKKKLFVKRLSRHLKKRRNRLKKRMKML